MVLPCQARLSAIRKSMPIRPENRRRYPDDWPQISERIRFARA